MDWKFGFCHGSLGNLGLEKAARLLSEAGCEAIELWSYHPSLAPYLSGKREPAEIPRLMKKHGLSYSVHAPHHDLNISGLNERIRRESILQTLEALNLAANMEAEVLVIHPGRRTTIEVPDQVYLNKSIEAIREICEKAHELGSGMRIAVENMDCKLIHFANTPEILLSILKGVGSLRLGITFDVAHANTCMDPVELFKKISDKVIHVHLADNTGPRSASFHMPLGTGSVDLIGFFRELRKCRYEGMLIVEGRGENPKDFIKRTLKFIKETLEEI